MPEEETATSAGSPARNSSRPEERYWTPTRRKGRPARRRRSPDETEGRPGWRSTPQGGWRWCSGGNATGRWRECVSGGLRAKRRTRRGRGGSCVAEDGDGTAGRRTGEEGEAAGGCRRHGRERRTAGRWLGTSGRLGRRQKRENARGVFHFIGEGREPGMGEGGTATGNTAGGHGRWPGMARPFRAIEGAIQGGN
uniref:BKRF1 encodes EBNA-1 protein-like n=1 Tax=Oryza glaberrima TaxID=4538 RepID=I1Q2D9_ORYGL